VLRVGRWESLKAVWRCLESLELFSVDALVDSFAFRRRIKHPILSYYILLLFDCQETARFWHSPLVSLWLRYFAMLPCYRFPMVYHGITMVLLYHNVSRIVWLWLASTAHWNACSTLFSRWDTAALGPAWIGSLTSWKHRDLRGMTRHDSAWPTAGLDRFSVHEWCDSSRFIIWSSVIRQEDTSSGFKWSNLSRCIVL